MPPGRWTALFFLDEATALAAGHRPCGYCRRADYLSYAEAWRQAQGLAQRPRAVTMDARLHAERVDAYSRRQLTRTALAGDLPDGVMVRRDNGPELLVGGSVLPWSWAGYRAPVSLSPSTPVTVLTPPATIAAITAGYLPRLHPSAAGVSHGLPVLVPDR
jgi:hypothetical protein